MGRMRMLAGAVGSVGLVAALVAVGGVVWVQWASSAVLNQRFEVPHAADFPVPFPLTDAELATLRAERQAQTPPPADGEAAPDPLAGVDLGAIALERAVERGKHVVEARYACGECHGANFGGGTMVDDPAIGQLLGPNLTTGKGSRTLTYTPADWDRLVRHGVKPDGTPTPMPSKDFFAMTDRELSDIVAYIRSLPAVDAEVPPPSYGPVGKVLVATGAFEFSAAVHPDHGAKHAVLPPDERPDAEFGEHIAQACTGCHRRDFNGGPIVGGPPDWPPAANLTALKGWSYEDFLGAMQQAKRPDGTALKPPMSDMPKLAAHMTETELKAMWAFLRTLPETPTGE